MNNRAYRQTYNWPQIQHYKQNIQNIIKQSKFTVKPLILPPEIVEYLMIVCDQLKVSIASLQLTLSVTAKYLRSKPNSLPLQLVAISSLMICCKFIETNPPQLSSLHKISCNSFTNKDFYRTEMVILNEINFEIAAQGIPNKEIGLVVRCVKSLLRPDYEQIFPSIVSDLELLFWGYLYSGRVKLREKEEKAITATLIHLSFVFLTQFSGRFLQTLWACQLTNTDEKDVTTLGNRVLKQILGEQKSKSYKI